MTASEKNIINQIQFLNIIETKLYQNSINKSNNDIEKKLNILISLSYKIINLKNIT